MWPQGKFGWRSLDSWEFVVRSWQAVAWEPVVEGGLGEGQWWVEMVGVSWVGLGSLGWRWGEGSLGWILWKEGDLSEGSRGVTSDKG